MTNKKATLATIKAFMRKNSNNLYIKQLSRFDGMVDCVMPSQDTFRNVSGMLRLPTKGQSGSCDAATMGLPGAWFVGGSRNVFTPFNDGKYTGYEVWNCCGSFIVATEV